MQLAKKIQDWWERCGDSHELWELTAEVDQLNKTKDNAYSERNKLVCLLTKLFPSSIEDHVLKEGEPWDEEWRKVIFIDLPTGQCTWHIHRDELPMFAHLTSQGRIWDGHTTEEKYKRIANMYLRPWSWRSIRPIRIQDEYPMLEPSVPPPRSLEEVRMREQQRLDAILYKACIADVNSAPPGFELHQEIKDAADALAADCESKMQEMVPWIINEAFSAPADHVSDIGTPGSASLSTGQD